jgi:DNA polymerase-3 subunit epsilon
VREIVIDTETTGLDPASGHRVVEIAAVELMHHVPTGRKFHCYINPERDMPPDAFAVHGLSDEFLAEFPVFAAAAEEFAAFIGDDPLVAHNAEFDLGFLNAELTRIGRPRLLGALVDTLALARKRFPGAPASLDALCRRFAIDLSGREKHGAEIDCLLLAEVYIELLGGRQPGLDLAVGAAAAMAAIEPPALRSTLPPRPHAPSDEELAAHAAMLETMKAPMWREAASLSQD